MYIIKSATPSGIVNFIQRYMQWVGIALHVVNSGFRIMNDFAIVIAIMQNANYFQALSRVNELFVSNMPIIIIIWSISKLIAVMLISLTAFFSWCILSTSDGTVQLVVSLIYSVIGGYVYADVLKMYIFHVFTERMTENGRSQELDIQDRENLVRLVTTAGGLPPAENEPEPEKENGGKENV